MIRRDLIADGVILVGIAAGLIGGWQLSPPWTLVVIGVGLVALGIAGVLGARRDGSYIRSQREKTTETDA